MKRSIAVLAALSLGASVFAAPITIEFWHAMAGKNGDATQ